MRIKISRETGLPEIPFGYYWDVSRGEKYFEGMIEVTLVGPDGPIKWDCASPEDYPVKRVIKNTAKSILRRYLAEKSLNEEIESHIGHYPPKVMR